MNRAVIGLDRFLGVVVGIVLIVLGALGIFWYAGVLLDRFPRIGSAARSTASGMRTGVGQSWWPWVAGIVGLVLGILGLIWLLRHPTLRGVREVRLPGSGKTGRLTVSTGPVLDAACAQLQATRGVRSASSRLTDERGDYIAELDLTVDPGADLTVVADDINRAVAELATALDNPDVTYRASVSVARTQKIHA